MNNLPRFEKAQFEKAQSLYFKINSLDCRVWDKDGQNEKEYRKLKSAVRAWDYAITFGYMDDDGNVLISQQDYEMAKHFEKEGCNKEWGNDLHKKYLKDENIEYRKAVNAGSKIIEVEGILNISHMENVYNTHKDLPSLPVDGKFGSNYTMDVLSGKYTEG